jgi:hypothetical protein
MALPGMEQHAHPWAGMLAKGMKLGYTHETDLGSHRLSAHDDHEEYGELNWADRTGGTGNSRETPVFHPGEVQWVENHGGPAGTAKALFRSGHAFDFGQDTLPLHSQNRSMHGDKFAASTMPELKPISDHGPARYNLPENFHPFEQKAAERQRARAKPTKPGPAIGKGQRKLF